MSSSTSANYPTAGILGDAGETFRNLVTDPSFCDSCGSPRKKLAGGGQTTTAAAASAVGEPGGEPLPAGATAAPTAPEPIQDHVFEKSLCEVTEKAVWQLKALTGHSEAFIKSHMVAFLQGKWRPAAADSAMEAALAAKMARLKGAA